MCGNASNNVLLLLIYHLQNKYICVYAVLFKTDLIFEMFLPPLRIIFSEIIPFEIIYSCHILPIMYILYTLAKILSLLFLEVAVIFEKYV